MFVDVLFSFQRTSHHLVLATLLVYHVQLSLSNTFLFFWNFLIVSFSQSFLMTLLVYHACRLLSNSFSIFQQLFLGLWSKKKHSWSVVIQIGAGEENRTLTVSLEGWSSTIKLHPQLWNGPATSYSRTCVLPSALRSLTSVFGMGTGVPSLPSSLDHWKMLLIFQN